MRILALLTEAFGGRGGIAAFNRNLVEALMRTGSADAISIVSRGVRPYHSLPTEITWIPARASRRNYTSAAVAASLLCDCDAILCGHLHLAPLAVTLAGTKPIIGIVHGVEAWARPSWLRRFSFNRFARVGSVSAHTRQRILDWSTLPSSRTRIVPNTLTEQFIDETAAVLTKPKTTSPYVLSVGRLSTRERYKGQDAVIRAMPALLRAVDGLRYVVAGEGDWLPELRQLARRLGVEHAVDFRGYVPDSELLDLYGQASVFALPSSGEGFGIVYLEAAACGVPSVAGAYDAGAEVVVRLGGRPVDPTDDNAVAAAIASLVRDPPPPEQLRSEAIRQFGPRAFDRAVLELMDGLVGRSG